MVHRHCKRVYITLLRGAEARVVDLGEFGCTVTKRYSRCYLRFAARDLVSDAA